MKIRNITVNRLPGIDRQFTIDDIGDGIQILHGPNGIGKSSIGLAVESIFWEGAYGGQSILVNASFDDGPAVWKGDREGSRVSWQKDGISVGLPSLPSQHLSHCFFLRLSDLLNATDQGASEFAEGIHRQLSGGYDIANVRSSLFSAVKKTHGNKQAANYRQSSEDLDKAEEQQVTLRAQENDLEKLAEKIEKADAARERLTDVGIAVELVGHRHELAVLSEKIDALPDNLDKLSGKESEKIKELKGELVGKKEEKQDHEHKFNLAKTIEQESGLKAEIDPVELTDWKNNDKKLIGLENKLGDLETKESVHLAKVLAAQKAVGKTNAELQGSFDVPQSTELLEFLDKDQNVTRKIKTLNERIQYLEKLGATDDRAEDDSLGILSDGRGYLSAWLREDGATGGTPGFYSKVLLIAGLTSVVIGAVSSLMDMPLGLLGVAFGVGLAAATFLKGKASSKHNYKADAEKKYQDLGIASPTAWNEAEVTRKLRDLDELIGKQTAKKERDRDRDGDRTALQHNLEIAKEEQLAVELERKALFAKLNIDDQTFNPGIVVLVRSLEELRKENSELAAAKAVLAQHRADYDALIVGFNSIFNTYGIAHDARDNGEVESRLNELIRKNSQFIKAVTDQESQAKAITKLDDEIGKTQETLDAVYEQASVLVGDDAALSSKLEALPEYQNLNENVQGLQPLIKEKSQKLTNSKNNDLLEKPKEELGDEAEKLLARAERAEELREQRTLTIQKIKEFKEGNNLETLILEQDLALEKLGEKREEALKSLAGGYLLDLVESEHEQTQTPKVFSRAMDLFSTFTNHKYELKLPTSSENPELSALDTQTNEIKALGSLSDGTRTQLLLAAKIAYAEEVEQGVTLPIFLDEALVQSDPNRFATIIENLGKVAADSDRQIFYLTSDPFDIKRISHILAKKGYPAPGSIDVAAARNVKYQVTSPIELEVANAPVVPAPNGTSPEEYAVALEVTRFNPLSGADDQHLFYLLRDNTDLLYKLVSARIKTTGQWRQVSNSPFAEKICEKAGTAALLNNRLEVLDQFCQLWSRGRGIPLDRTVLEASQAFTKNNIDEAADLCNAYEGDAEAFVRALNNGELKRYSAKKQEALYSYLVDSGYIDPADNLDVDAINLQLLTSSIGSEMSDFILGHVQGWYDLASVEPGAIRKCW